MQRYTHGKTTANRIKLIRATRIYEVYPFLLDDSIGTPEHLEKLSKEQIRKMKDYVEYIVLTEYVKVCLITEIPFVNEFGELEYKMIVFDDHDDIDTLCEKHEIKNISLVSLN